MIDWYEFSAVTGEVMGCGSAQEEDVHRLTARAGLVLGMGTASTANYVRDGQLATYTPEQAAAKASRPQDAEWSNTTMSWQEARSLEELKVAKWRAIKAERQRRIAEPKMTSIGAFDADAESSANLANVIALTQLAVARGMPGTARYTLADNVRQVLTLEQMQTAALEMGAQVQSIFDQADTLRTAIDAASAADLAGIDWPPA